MGTNTHFICYSDPKSYYSHCIRLVLIEKDADITIANVDPYTYPSKLAELNPYTSLPVLVERDLVLYNSMVIMEYLEERYPYPSLLQAYPIGRARQRLLMHRIERDWVSLLHGILDPKTSDTKKQQMRKELRESLMGISAVFSESTYFLSDEFSLVDCCLLPLLWRLPLLGIEIPSSAKPLLSYMDNCFYRKSFQESLSPWERTIRKEHF